ncbi:MAG: diaminopimelate decarboxylase, partial [Muribaculaceae bacterium]|nr:diaminopimelate decarboxylase [Muribaculaceae bacterium]
MYSTNFPIRQFNAIPTPFYFYDLKLLDATLAEINSAAGEAGGDKFCVHYAVKANANPVVLNRIAQAGLGADCVSMGEIIAALSAG